LGRLGKAVNRPFNCEFVSSTLRTTPSKAVALAPSELVGVVETGERGWRIRLPARHWIGRLSPENLSGRFDAIAGVMVLSEVAGRLMMMSGSGASTCTTGYGRAATSRLTEVTTTTVPADIASPADRARKLAEYDQVGFAWPQSNDVPSTQMQ
jgi:hypothetical protein